MINLSLAGKTYRSIKDILDLDNSKILQSVLDCVGFQFGEEAIYISDGAAVSINNLPYPEYYAAGWFVSNEPITDTDGKGSHLVVVSHGDSMKAAKEAMMKAITYAEWDDLAVNT